jgi:hypothetical protein
MLMSLTKCGHLSWRTIVQQIADEIGISRCSANTILNEDFGMERVASKFVPRLLSPEQQKQDMLECSNGYHRKTKVQSQ